MAPPELVIGCPLRDRMWILPLWFERVATALKSAGMDKPLLVFVGDVNDESMQYAEREAEARGWGCSLVPVTEPQEPYSREWNIDRYRYMVDLRNRLLTEVKEWAPQVFWSLDSDILVHEDALKSAIDALDRFDAVGQRCYMTEHGTWCPSYCNFTEGGGLLRYDGDGCFPVDCIMASKVMSPRAYDIAYEVHEQGEDIGWSKECRRFGVKLGWDGRTVSKHVMGIEFLHLIDPRCGY